MRVALEKGEKGGAQCAENWFSGEFYSLCLCACSANWFPSARENGINEREVFGVRQRNSKHGVESRPLPMLRLLNGGT